jgi:hypothetical protein
MVPVKYGIMAMPFTDLGCVLSSPLQGERMDFYVYK